MTIGPSMRDVAFDDGTETERGATEYFAASDADLSMAVDDKILVWRNHGIFSERHIE